MKANPEFTEWLDQHGMLSAKMKIANPPWTVDISSVGDKWTDSVSIAHANGGHVAHLTRGFEGNENGGCPSWGHAFLIAAAPDLLEALREVVALSDRKHNAWDKAHAAIAKAEGSDAQS